MIRANVVGIKVNAPSKIDRKSVERFPPPFPLIPPPPPPQNNILSPRKSYRRGQLCTVDLLVLTSLDRLLLILKTLFTPFIKQVTFNEEINCTEPSRSVGIPCFANEEI
jgi:hypothetical protein